MKKIYEYNEINNIFSIDGICFKEIKYLIRTNVVIPGKYLE